MKKRYINPMTLISVIFIAVGLIFFIIGCSFFVIGAVNQNKGEEITAVVTAIERYRESDGDIGHHVFVDYEYDGVEYKEMPLNYYSSSMRQGKKISINIDPDEPSHILASGFNMIFGGIFGGSGLVFVIIGGIVLIKGNKRKALINRLLAEGYYIEAQLGCVEPTNVRVNGRPTYVIRCNYLNPADGRVYSFKSEQIAFDPTPFLSGDTLRVYVDRNDFTKNYVDVSEFKEKYIEC